MWKLINRAIKEVPATKWALGIAGAIALLAVVKGLFGGVTGTLVAGAVVTVLMILMLLFAALAGLARRALRPLALLMAWSFLLLFVMSGVLTATSLFFDWPKPLPALKSSIFGNRMETFSGATVVATWLSASKAARENQSVHPGQPFPTSLVSARANFEDWWANSGLQQRRAISNVELLQALAYVVQTHRLEEERSPDKPNSIYWADQAIRHFEEVSDGDMLGDALLEKAAIYGEISNFSHTDPEKLRAVAKEGDAVMARAVMITKGDDLAEVYRSWSRFYYSLARPADGNLSRPWDNNYLHTAYQKARRATEVSTHLRNATQLARVAQRLAANPPQDVDEKWTIELREVQRTLLGRWEDFEPTLRMAGNRIGPLNNIAVLTMACVQREWREAIQNGVISRGEKLARELKEVAIPYQRESLVTARTLPEYSSYSFDYSFDLARMFALRVAILEMTEEPTAGADFAEAIKAMRDARRYASSTQLDAALASVDGESTFLALSIGRRAELRNALTREN